ncbi:hypothetical protein HRR83_002978 [Exophiala dermatitidis]|nr:hypothetical protein HRR75_003289 [Exophiala dermatitidis]KAJ4543431.1 hypothetical protein HRR78_006484 [Exophiala dermatitidis]KAJ4601777.1 hypothetical protein HRR83_002978 [Exophiala dermatitidis]KAJ4627732.1 hypothetical protein HRR86_003930 [Exophiala dermatitidis]
MASKYAFTQGLRELRFHLCGSSQASEAARYAYRYTHHTYAYSPNQDAMSNADESLSAAAATASLAARGVYILFLREPVMLTDILSFARSFLKRAYPTMKHHNPNTPILIREATGVEPKVWARYGYGKEKSESLSGLSDKEIENRVTELVKHE